MILVIDDNQDLLNVVSMAMESEGHGVLAVRDGPTGLELFRQHHPDLVILDIMMPGMNGWEVCRRLREASSVPIILLTVLGQETDIVRGLQEGADDYVAKPFSIRELVERVEALLRRARMVKERTEKQNITAGNLVLVQETHRVIINDRVIKLTPIEFRLLSTLVENAGRVVSHHELLRQVWGEDYKADTRQLKVYIHYLRKKLESDPRNPCYILSEWGTGYRLAI